MTMNIEASNVQNKAFPSSTIVSSSEKITAAVEQTILDENKNGNTRIIQLKICTFSEVCKECMLYEESAART